MAAIVEALVETLKMIWDKNQIHKSKIVSIIIGVAVAIMYQIDLLAAVGVFAIFPVFGYILTGILISRGSNFVSDFLRVIREIGE